MDNVIGIENTQTLLLNSSTFVELRGALEKILYFPPKNRCETLFLKLREAPHYLFKVSVPTSAVSTINLLYEAISTEVVLKSKNNSSKKGEDGVTIVNLSYISVDGYTIPFYNKKLLD